MPSPNTYRLKRPRWMMQPAIVGWIAIGVLAVGYPLLADATERPLGVFLIPVLLTSALGTWKDTTAVAVAAIAAASIAGLWHDDWSRAGLAARLATMAVGSVIAVVVAFERGRRQRILDATHSRSLLLDTFQDSLVPAPIPPPNIVVRTRYIPGDERLMLGGDFFDAIRLPNGALGYVIGDVCGQGPRAAAFGAAVRSGWKALATTSPEEPLRWIHGLDETFFRLGRHSDTFVTLNTGTVKLDGERRWTFVSAGHPWPIVLQDGVNMVKPNVGPPLGAGMRSGWKETVVPIAPASVVMLYTDGLIENPLPGERRSHDGERRLLEHLSRAGFDLDDLLDTFGPVGFDDDVAVMTIAVE